MPELPEVETVVKGLREQIVGQQIDKINLFYEPLLHTPYDIFMEHVLGQKIIGIERFGKYILLVLGNQKVIRVHLRMEGKFFITTTERDAMLDKHVHLVLKLGEHRYLKYHDVRKFGTFELIDREKNWHDDAKFASLGYEPWEPEFTPAFLFDRMNRSHQMIKPFLLDQKTLVGLGNIYVDEVLFATKIHPQTRAESLRKKDAVAIREVAINVLQQAIALGGTTIRTYHNTLGIDGMFQNELQVHLRQGEHCQRCDQSIIKIKVGGRGTYLCPNCQKVKSKR